MAAERQRARTSRWRSAAEVVSEVRREPGITRAALAQRLGLSSGSATEITARLREACLLTEEPAPAEGRGRPTTVLRAHPAGPLVLGVDVRHRDWRCVAAGIDGAWDVLGSGDHEGRSAADVLRDVRAALAEGLRGGGGRVRAISLALPGVVTGTVLRQAPPLGWRDVDLAPLGDLPGAESLLLLAGNDATLAGVAEARSGGARGARVALYVLVAGAIGGALVLDGRPVAGATGAAGEFGHLPMGGSPLRCTCGARGCWDLVVGANALARALGDPLPDDPRGYARRVIARSVLDEAARGAVEANASALGVGVAGLVNALDPDVVTLAGLAGDLRAAAPGAFEAAFADGLMGFRAGARPPVLESRLADDGALLGAIAVALDVVTEEAALDAWASAIQARA